MQSAAPEAVDWQTNPRRRENCTAWTKRKRGPSAQNCLLARRLVERGVRFVELYCGSRSGWDAHENIENHSQQVVQGV